MRVRVDSILVGALAAAVLEVNAQCQIKPGEELFRVAEVSRLFGDVKVRLNAQYADSVSIDVKGPGGFEKRNIRILWKQQAVFKVCDREVSVGYIGQSDTYTKLHLDVF